MGTEGEVKKEELSTRLLSDDDFLAPAEVQKIWRYATSIEPREHSFLIMRLCIEHANIMWHLMDDQADESEQGNIGTLLAKRNAWQWLEGAMREGGI